VAARATRTAPEIEPFGELDLEAVRKRERRPQLKLPDHRRVHFWMRVAEDHRTERERVIDVSVPIGIPDPASRGALGKGGDGALDKLRRALAEGL
jgi:hypothetical protein